MGEIITGSFVAYSDIDLTWMVGRSISQVTFNEPQYWCFHFGSDAWIGPECLWRIIKRGKVVLTCEDHGQKFGLPAPIDATAKSNELLLGPVVTSAHLREATADVAIDFGEGLRLEVIPNSSGYESWQIRDPLGSNFVATGGGRICQWKS